MELKEQVHNLIASVKTLTDILIDTEDERDYFISQCEHLEKRYQDTYAVLQNKHREIGELKQKIEDLLAERNSE